MGKLKPVLVTFRGELAKVPTVRQISMVGQRHFNGAGFATAAKNIAKRAGGLHVLRSDGALIVFTRLESGNIRRKTYPIGSYRFEA